MHQAVPPNTLTKEPYSCNLYHTKTLSVPKPCSHSCTEPPAAGYHTQQGTRQLRTFPCTTTVDNSKVLKSEPAGSLHTVSCPPLIQQHAAGFSRQPIRYSIACKCHHYSAAYHNRSEVHRPRFWVRSLEPLDGATSCKITVAEWVIVQNNSG